MESCSAPQWGGFTTCATAPIPGRSRSFFKGVSNAMTQSELNRQISKQTGEPVAEIARLGFTILKELTDDKDDEPPQSRPQTPTA